MKRRDKYTSREERESRNSNVTGLNARINNTCPYKASYGNSRCSYQNVGDSIKDTSKSTTQAPFYPLNMMLIEFFSFTIPSASIYCMPAYTLQRFRSDNHI